MSARTPATRRLQRLLNNENYGPKLARLNKGDQRRVLDFVDRNQGRNARALILQLDERRRQTRRIRESVRKFSRRAATARTGSNRPTTWTREHWDLYDALDLS